jgi:hypothetical protein
VVVHDWTQLPVSRSGYQRGIGTDVSCCSPSEERDLRDFKTLRLRNQGCNCLLLVRIHPHVLNSGPDPWSLWSLPPSPSELPERLEHRTMLATVICGRIIDGVGEAAAPGLAPPSTSSRTSAGEPKGSVFCVSTPPPQNTRRSP